MRALGLVGLVVALALVGLLAKKQLTAAAAPASTPGVTSTASTPKQQVEQVRQAVDAAMRQAPRAMPDEGK